MLLQPFVAGAVLARSWTWLLLPALGLVLLGFMLREPLVVLARHVLLWRVWNGRARSALHWTLAEVFGVLACMALLLPHLPAMEFAMLAAAWAVLTAVAVWISATNRQRSTLFQVVSAAGLGTTSLLAVLASTATLPVWSWQLWGILTLHAASAILVVHARLRLKTASKRDEARRPRAAAFAAQFVQSLAAAVVLIACQPALSVPLFFSSAVNFSELARMSSKGGLLEPLRRVGFRTLGASIVHSAVTIAVLWPTTG